MMDFRILAIVMLIAAYGGGAQASEFHQYEYAIIGGKHGSPRETLHLDCRSLQATFSREATSTPANAELLKKTISAEECQQIRQLAQELCINQENHDPTIMDGTTHTLSCGGKSGATQWVWYGSLREAPKALQKLHDRTRELINLIFGNPLRYP